MRKQRHKADPLKTAHKEIDRTARTLLRTDLQLHRANARFDQQISQLNALRSIGSSLNSTFDLEIILNTVCESMIKDLDFEKSGIVFVDKNSSKPKQSAYAGFSAAEFRILLDQFYGLLMPALQQEDICLVTIDQTPSDWTPVMTKLGVSSLVFMPMWIKSRLIGFIVGARTHLTVRLSESERRFYAMYATQASIAMEHARLYKALEQANLTLEERVVERTKNLMDANERLKELDQVKSNFISLISHELRTPLTAIKGFVGTMYQYDHEISDEKRHVYLRVLNEETDRLTRLICEMLDISRIESGQIETQWKLVLVPEVVKDIFYTLRIKAGPVKMVMDFPEPFPAIKADLDKLEQILLNLLDNAIRFSPRDGTVTVSGHPTDTGIVIEIQDAGPGIAFSEQEKIFDKFFRLDNEVNRKYPGTGLGLSICRALVNLHGGKIWAESEENLGCRILFTLPINMDKKTAPAFLLPSTAIPNQKFTP
ncbi:MAG: ATP-binding protein [Elusimicrobiota bacterium]